MPVNPPKQQSPGLRSRWPVTLALCLPFLSHAQVEDVQGSAEQGARSSGAARPPMPVHVVRPVSPPSLVDHHSGCARLVFTIRADGRVDDIRFNARPTSAYGKAARDALAQWRFTPSGEDREAFQSFVFEINTEGRWTAGHADGGTESEACRGLAWP